MKKHFIILSLTALALFSLNARDLSLAEYMTLVEKNSRDLYQADIDKELAGAQEKLARSATRPMISAGLGYTRNLLELTMPYAAYAEDSGTAGVYDIVYRDVPYNSNNDFSANVGLQQLLFDVKVFKALQASRQYRELTGTIYEATRQGILTAAKQLYYQTVLSGEFYNVAKATEQNAYETYQNYLLKYENEIASELEVLQAEVNWQINIPATTQAARNRDLALSNLKLLAGLNPDDEINLSESLTAIPAGNGKEALGTILGNRPDYQAIQGEIALREINISATRAEFFPSLSATAAYGWQVSNDDFVLEDPTEVMQVGLALTIPLYYGGSRFAKMEQSRLELEKSRVNLLQKQDEVRTEINNLQLLLEEASSRIVSAETTVKTAEKAYRITEISAENGLATQLELKDALLNQAGAKLNYYSAIYDYLNAYFQWQQAVGEGDRLPF